MFGTIFVIHFIFFNASSNIYALTGPSLTGLIDFWDSKNDILVFQKGFKMEPELSSIGNKSIFKRFWVLFENSSVLGRNNCFKKLTLEAPDLQI